MKKDSRENRRKYDRYETDVKIQFYVNFDLTTKVKYRVKKEQDRQFSAEKYPATSKNISAEGMCFVSPYKLNPGDKVLMDVFVPSTKNPVKMTGTVRWSTIEEGKGDNPSYQVGVQIETVDEEPVPESIFVDRVHNVIWSNVLESIFGSFKTSALNRARKRSAQDK